MTHNSWVKLVLKSMGVRDIFLARPDHRLGFKLKVSDWLRVSTNQHQFETPCENKCTNKYRFGRVAWKGQFLVNKPINNNQCSYGQPGTYSHIQDRYLKKYLKTFQMISISATARYSCWLISSLLSPTSTLDVGFWSFQNLEL